MGARDLTCELKQLTVTLTETGVLSIQAFFQLVFTSSKPVTVLKKKKINETTLFYAI